MVKAVGWSREVIGRLNGPYGSVVAWGRRIAASQEVVRGSRARLVAFWTFAVCLFIGGGLLPIATNATRSNAIRNAVVPTVRVSGNKLIDPAGNPVRLIGVDVSGTEDACVEGGEFGWGSLNSVEAGQIASWDANAVRVPLNEDCWLGINGAPAKYSGAPYRAAIERWVADLNSAGIVAILDLHWSAPGNYEATEQWPMADADHSVTFWSQVASAFAPDPSVVFDLFNEPFIGKYHPTSADWACWLNGCTTTFAATIAGVSTNVTYVTAGMQQLLDAVRDAGATQPVMVGGLNWAGDPCGIYDTGGNGGSCAWLTYEPNDPLHQLIASFHTYNWSSCNTLSCWNSDVAPLAVQVPVVTGEFGEEDCSTTYISAFMSWADQRGISYLAWSWEPPNNGDTVCVVGSGNNLDLLRTWTGSPSTIDPEGANLRHHLITEHAQSLYAYPGSSKSGWTPPESTRFLALTHGVIGPPNIWLAPASSFGKLLEGRWNRILSIDNLRNDE